MVVRRLLGPPCIQRAMRGVIVGVKHEPFDVALLFCRPPLLLLSFFSLSSLTSQMAKRKQFGTHYDFSADEDSDEDALGGSASTAPQPTVHTTQMLRETTHVAPDGSLRHAAQFLTVPASPSKKSGMELLRPDEPNTDAGPLFEQEGGLDSEPESDSDDEDGGRALRDSVSSDHSTRRI